MSSIEFYVALILKITGGSLLCTVPQIAQAKNQSNGSVRNAISSGTFPVHTFLDNGRRVSTVLSLATYLGGKDTPPPVKPTRGRPQKTSKMMAGGV